MAWDILGHKWAAEMLRQHIATGSLRHAYLFSGPNGVGRRTLALQFAQAVNCTQPVDAGVPCGECRACTQTMRMQQADLSVVQSEAEGESLKVDQVRVLQQALSLTAYESSYRVALLLRFEEATHGAQNALLKTLEEPNERVLLLVTADDPDNLLPTITSRCELMRLRPMSPDDLAVALLKRKNIPEEKAEMIAHAAGGRPGTALRMTEDDSILEKRDEWINTFFNLVEANQRDRLMFSQSKTYRIPREIAKKDLREGFTHWLSLWRDCMLLASGSGTPLTNPDAADRLEIVAGRVGVKEAARLAGRLEHSFTRMSNANLQLMMDNLLLEWPRI